ncbi:MAG: DUF362 domain-containing protein [Candidatus Aminicenantes bacterium]|nr:DUF362 domain-containing protein [Candidatus Aminicenantes bacterium]
MKRKEIVLIKETRQNEVVKKIMEAIAPFLSIRSSNRVAIKINLSGAKEIYANTHYETVDSMIRYLRDKYGIAQITVIEGSDGAFFSGKTTWDIFYKFKYKEIEMQGAQLCNLDDLAHDQVLNVETISGPQQVYFCRFPADYLISIVPPKTHNIFPVSLSVPNLIGFVKQEQRVLMFGASNQEMKRINFIHSEKYFQLLQLANRNFVALLKQIQPSLVVIDGLYGMEGKGPIKGSPVFHGFAIASEDAVMADALATHVMGFSGDDVPYLALANSEGLGNNHWQNVIGVDPQTVKFPYRPHPLFQRQRKWREARSRNEGAAGKSPAGTVVDNQPPKGTVVDAQPAENRPEDHEENHSPQN